MCKFCKHADLKLLKEDLRAKYGLTPTERAERKALLKRIEWELREAKHASSNLRRSGDPTVYRADYVKSALKFAAMVLNTPDWTNGGNLIL